MVRGTIVLVISVDEENYMYDLLKYNTLQTSHSNNLLINVLNFYFPNSVAFALHSLSL